MKRFLALAIEAGEKTCASKPGCFCPQIRSYNFGQQFRCNLFGQDLAEEPFGWLQRLPDCLAAEALIAEIKEAK